MGGPARSAAGRQPVATRGGKRTCTLCGSHSLHLVESITRRPARETNFGISPDIYAREIVQCGRCGVFNNFHSFDFERLYNGEYNKSTYQKAISERYDAIMALPYEKSDNKHRVERIYDFARRRKIHLAGLEVLDVGSGLCVFLGEFLKHGIEASCIDPDVDSVNHARSKLNIKDGIVGSFDDISTTKKYNLITFNKVLEHVKNPIAMLRKASSMLGPDGLLYLELPDGESALRHEPAENREEFFIEHYFIFSGDSMRFLLKQAQLECLEADSIHEPSDKYTVFAFARPQGAGSTSFDEPSRKRS